MESKSVFSPSIVNGILVAVVLVIFNLVLFLLDVGKESYIQVFYHVIFALGIAWAIFSVRNNKLDGYATYGKAFTIGVFASISIAVIMAIYTYVNMKYIDPGMVSDALSQAEDAMIEANPEMSDDDLNNALEITKMIMQPGLMSIIRIFTTLMTGTIFSLIIAIFAKNESQQVSM
jgi:hypothetical protein